MATNNQLNYGWLADLPNAHHDGTSLEINSDPSDTDFGD